MRLGLLIAVKFLKSNKGQTILIILGIAIGVSVQLFIGSLIQGLQKGLVEKTIGNSSQITITFDNETERLSNYSETINLLNENIVKEELPINTVQVVDDNPALLVFGEETQSVLVRGFESLTNEKIYDIKSKLVSGVLPSKVNEILIGTDLKDAFDLSLNDKISILGTNQITYECIVVGFYDLSVASLNKSWVITSNDTTNSIFKNSDTITSIEMQVDNDFVFEVDTIATTLANDTSNELIFTNWKSQNQQLLSGLNGQSVSSLLIQVFVMISVVLGIASVLAITVLQKSRQIGILKAMGLKNRITSYVFIFEGLILGIIGTATGIGLSLIMSYSFTKYVVNPDGTPVVSLFISPSFIIISAIIAITACVVAALIPAINSSKLNPIDIIRNN